MVVYSIYIYIGLYRAVPGWRGAGARYGVGPPSVRLQWRYRGGGGGGGGGGSIPFVAGRGARCDRTSCTAQRTALGLYIFFINLELLSVHVYIYFNIILVLFIYLNQIKTVIHGDHVLLFFIFYVFRENFKNVVSIHPSIYINYMSYNTFCILCIYRELGKCYIYRPISIYINISI